MALTPHAIRASSVLDEDDTYAPSALLLGGDDACWRSGGGGAQWLTLHFPAPGARVRALELVFQGGFAGAPMHVDVSADEADGAADGEAWARAASFAPEDSNDAQRFELPAEARGVRALRLAFPASSDFFGRVVLYRVSVFG